MKKTESLQDIAMAFVNTRTEATFTRLYNRLKPGLANLARKYHKDEEIVNEILSITLSKAYTLVHLYDSRWNFSTWVYKICQIECLMELRRQNALCGLDTLKDGTYKSKALHREDWVEVPKFEEFDGEEGVESHVVYDEIMDMITELPDVYRDILQDREIHKLKYEEISQKRDIKINTVRSRIHVAKKILRQRWKDRKREEGNTSVIIKNVTTVEL